MPSSTSKPGYKLSIKVQAKGRFQVQVFKNLEFLYFVKTGEGEYEYNRVYGAEVHLVPHEGELELLCLPAGSYSVKLRREGETDAEPLLIKTVTVDETHDSIPVVLQITQEDLREESVIKLCVRDYVTGKPITGAFEFLRDISYGVVYRLEQKENGEYCLAPGQGGTGSYVMKTADEIARIHNFSPDDPTYGKVSLKVWPDGYDHSDEMWEWKKGTELTFFCRPKSAAARENPAQLDSIPTLKGWEKAPEKRVTGTFWCLAGFVLLIVAAAIIKCFINKHFIDLPCLQALLSSTNTDLGYIGMLFEFGGTILLAAAVATGIVELAVKKDAPAAYKNVMHRHTGGLMLAVLILAAGVLFLVLWYAKGSSRWLLATILSMAAALVYIVLYYMCAVLWGKELLKKEEPVRTHLRAYCERKNSNKGRRNHGFRLKWGIKELGRAPIETEEWESCKGLEAAYAPLVGQMFEQEFAAQSDKASDSRSGRYTHLKERLGELAKMDKGNGVVGGFVLHAYAGSNCRFYALAIGALIAELVVKPLIKEPVPREAGEHSHWEAFGEKQWKRGLQGCRVALEQLKSEQKNKFPELVLETAILVALPFFHEEKNGGKVFPEIFKPLHTALEERDKKKDDLPAALRYVLYQDDFLEILDKALFPAADGAWQKRGEKAARQLYEYYTR